MEIFTMSDNKIIVDDSICKAPLVFEGDSIKIQQCILNLFVNAKDAMPHGGKISVSTYLCNDLEYLRSIRQDVEYSVYNAIEISDTGMGIPKDILDNVFEPIFLQLKKKGKARGLV